MTIPSSPESGNGHTTTCTCVLFKRNNECKHENAVDSNVLNRLELMSFPVCGVSPVENTSADDLWTCIPVLEKKNDEVSIWQVFWRKHLSPEYPTSSVIFCDCRLKTAEKKLGERSWCVLCPGKPGTRMNCARDGIIEVSCQ